jgi:hypothetical protein
MLRRNNSKARNLALAVWMPGSIGERWPPPTRETVSPDRTWHLGSATATPIEPGTFGTEPITIDPAESVRLTVHSDEDRFDQS